MESTPHHHSWAQLGQESRELVIHKLQIILGAELELQEWNREVLRSDLITKEEKKAAAQNVLKTAYEISGLRAAISVLKGLGHMTLIHPPQPSVLGQIWLRLTGHKYQPYIFIECHEEDISPQTAATATASQQASR